MNPIPFECNIDVSKAYEEEERWIVEGFAATSDFDLQEDIITEQAIKASARDLMQNSTVLLNHSTNDSIGRVEKSEARRDGLWLKIYISKTVPQIWQKIREGVLNKFSIRGKILKAKKQWVEKLKRFARVIFKMHLLEVSLVAVPANPNAKAVRWYIEKALDDYEAGGGEIETITETDYVFNEGEVDMDNENGVIEEELIEAYGDDRNGEGVSANASGGEAQKNAEGKPDDQKPGTEAAQVVAEVDALLEKERDETRKQLFTHIREIAKEVMASEEAGEDVEKAGRKISSSRLTRLRKLLDELQRIVMEVEPGDAENTKGDKGQAKKDEVGEKLDALEKGLSDISKHLGLVKEEGKEKGDEKPTLVGMLKALSDRLEAIEGIPAVKTSLDGQEKLADEQEGGNVWKGLI